MNWKPKKGVGKTLYAIDTWNYNFNSSSKRTNTKV